MAMVVANWAPHLTAALLTGLRTSPRRPYDPLAPVNALAWPLWRSRRW